MASKPVPTVVGKRGEITFISALLRRGFAVFTPVVDVGIDVVAEKFAPMKRPKYFAFQVKTSTFQKSGSWFWYIEKEKFRCSNTNFNVFVFEDTHLFPPQVPKDSEGFYALIIPSKKIEKEASKCSNRWKRGEDYNITVTPNMLRNTAKWQRYKWMRYFNDWKQLQ